MFWKFVDENIHAAPEALRLKYHGKVMPFDIEGAITQIECRRKFGKKLADTLAAAPKWKFPSVLAGEQSTSDLLAQYHATLAAGAQRIVDLTAGLGIDAVHLAGGVQPGIDAVHMAGGAEVTAVEIDEAKAEALRQNVKEAGFSNINVVCQDCREFLAATDQTYDVAFIDPARRADDGKRTFALSDCQPDVTALIPDISRIAKRLIIKMSPMLDITAIIHSLPSVTRVIALGTTTECKELIAVIDFANGAGAPVIEAVTLRDTAQITYAFTPAQEKESAYSLIDPKNIHEYRYLYEPYPAVMKAAPFRLLSSEYGIDKVASNTHIFLSRERVEAFPGDCLQIVKVLTYESKHIKRLRREYPQISVTTRNFPISADALRAKLAVKDGGNHRLFAVTAPTDTKYMLICQATH